MTHGGQQPIRRTRKPVFDQQGFLPCQPDEPWRSVTANTITGTVSVIIPAYNSLPTLTYALKSCAWQTRQPDEVVIVDDASTDNTPALLENLSWLPMSTTVARHTVNRGAAAARNSAIRRATGEFVFYLDADDIMPDYRIQDTLHEFALTGADVIYGQKEHFSRDPNWRDQAPKASAPTPRTICGATGFGTCCVSVRRSVHVETEIWMDESMSVAEDAELLVACLSRGLEVHCSPKVYCWRRESDGSLRHRGDWTLMRQWLQVKHRAWLEWYIGRPLGLDAETEQRVRLLRETSGWTEG